MHTSGPRLIFIFFYSTLVALNLHEPVKRKTVRMKKTILLSSAFVLACCTASAQGNNQTVPDHRTCGTMDHLHLQKEKDPGLELRMQQQESVIQKFIDN